MFIFFSYAHQGRSVRFKFAIGSTDFVRLWRHASECNEQHFYARNQTNIQTQWFFKLRKCSIKKRRFIFYKWKPCYKVFKYNQPSIGLTDFVRLYCNASECDGPLQDSSDILDVDVGESTSKLVTCSLANWHVGETTITVVSVESYVDVEVL